MDNRTKDEIQNAVAGSRLDKAIEIFSNWANVNNDSEVKNQLFLLKSQLAAAKREENLGLVTPSETRMVRARLTNAILEMLTNPEPTPQKPEPTPPKPNGTDAILFLAANPSDTGKLQLDFEFRRVFQSLKDGRVTYNLETEFAVTPSELKTALLKYRPRIVHFSGHGVGGGKSVEPSNGSRGGGRAPDKPAGILLKNDATGASQLVSGAALAALFKVCLKIFKLEVVVLNACSSEEQAKAIFAAGVPYVVGMNTSVNDSTAIEFSASFYQGIASEGNVEIAFELAQAGIMLESLSGVDIPVLYKK